MTEEQKIDPVEIYKWVLDIVEDFLEQTHSIVSIAELRKLDPSVEEIANGMKTLAFLLRAEAENNSYEHQDMAINALQCAIKMSELGAIVKNGRQEDVDRVMKELAMHCNVPQRIM